MAVDKRKQSLYFPDGMLEELAQEAIRQDRSMSWLMQQAWKIAKPELEKMPTVSDVIRRAV